MANTLTPYLRTWLAAGLPVLRKAAVMPRLVNSDYSMVATTKGATLDFPIPGSLAVSDVTPATTPPTPSDFTPTTKQLTFNKWKQASFFLTDQDLTKISAGEHFLPAAMGAAMKALAEQINADIFAATHAAGGFYGFTGTAGTTPFASAVTDATNARKILNNQLCPMSPRYGVLDPDAEANALALSGFTSYDGGGQTAEASRVEGFLGRRYGFDWAMDQQVPTHTSGTGSGYLLNGAASAGATTLTVDTGSGTILAGDIITIAGVAGTYNVASSVGGSSVTSITIDNPGGLLGAAADNAAVTVKASHVVNLAFHRDAIYFAARPLSGQLEGFPGAPEAMALMQDPVTGLPLRAQVSRQHMQTAVYMDVLYGIAIPRPDFGMRIAG